MLGKLLTLYMRVENIGVRDLGKELGVSAATISRICRGEQVDMKTFFALMKWLFEKRREENEG